MTPNDPRESLTPMGAKLHRAERMAFRTCRNILILLIGLFFMFCAVFTVLEIGVYLLRLFLK